MQNVSILIDELNDVILTDYYTFIDTLGGGAYGKVVMAQSKELNQIVAIKIIERNKNKPQDQEASFLEQCQHKNIVRFHKLLYTQRHLYIVMEYLSGTTLNEVMQRQLSESKIRGLIKQMLEGLSYLHSQGIIHRDLKPSNILLVKENLKTVVKLIDLGLSYQISAHKMTTKQCGTLLYMAPELAQEVPYNQTVDIFALGIILYQLFNQGKHPFFTEDMKTSEYFKRLACLAFDVEYNSDMPHMAKDFIQKTMTLDPNDRMSAYQCLDHPWIKNVEEQQYPITTNEIISTFTVKLKLITIIKALMIKEKFVQLCPKKLQRKEEELRTFDNDSIKYSNPISQREKPPIYKSKMLKTVQGTFNTPQMSKRQVTRQSLAMSFINSPTQASQAKRTLKTPSPTQFRLPSIATPKYNQSPVIPSNIINKSKFFQH